MMNLEVGFYVIQVYSVEAQSGAATIFTTILVHTALLRISLA